MSLSSITPMPRIISPTISIVSYKYEHCFQRLIDDLICYLSFYFTKRTPVNARWSYQIENPDSDTDFASHQLAP